MIIAIVTIEALSNGTCLPIRCEDKIVSILLMNSKKGNRHGFIDDSSFVLSAGCRSPVNKGRDYLPSLSRKLFNTSPLYLNHKVPCTG